MSSDLSSQPKTDQNSLDTESNTQTPLPPTKTTKGGPLARFGGILASIWLLAIFFVWLWLHAPFMPPVPSGLNAFDVAAGLLSTILNLVLLPLILISSTALGLRLLAWLWPQTVTINQGEKLVFGAGLGLGAIGFLVLGFGMLGFLGWPLAYLLLFGSLALNFPQTRFVLASILAAWRNSLNWWKINSWLNRSLVLYMGIVLLLTLLTSFTPPTAWDSLMYHLAVPQLYLNAGIVGPQPQMFPANYPFGAEMLFTWAMALHNDTLAAAMHWSFGLLTAILLFLTANRFFVQWSAARRQLTGLLAAAFFLSVPLVQTLMTWAYTDLLMGFYALAALYLLILLIQTQSFTNNDKIANAWLRLAVLAGIMGGLSFGGKYWAIMALAGVGVAFLAIGAQEKLKVKTLWGSAIVFGLVALVVSAPWFARNWLFSDNPIAPFVFGAHGWTKAELSSFNTGSGLSLNLFKVLSLPFDLTVTGQTGGNYDATISPIFLGLAPLIVLAAVRDRLSSRFAILVAGLQFAAWTVVLTLNATLSETRALAPAFPLLALVSAFGLVALLEIKSAKLLRNFASFLIGLYFVSNLFNQIAAFSFTDALPFLTGVESRDAYLYQSLGSYWRVADFISTKLPQNAQVVSWLEPRSYYFNSFTRPDFHLDEFFYYLSTYPTPAQLEQALKVRGATHIIISERGLDFMSNTDSYGRVAETKADLPLLTSFENQYLTLLYEEKGEYAVYALK